MKNWFKCNKCYRRAIDSSKQFFVSQCEHVFCSACVVEARKQCPECKAVGSQTIILQTPMPQQMCHYFTSVSSLVERTSDAARFQQKQFMVALRHARHIEEKYEKGKRLYEQASKEIQTLLATQKKLRGDVEKLRLASVPCSAPPETFAPFSIVHDNNQSGHTSACVSKSLKSQYGDRHIVPDMLDSHCSHNAPRYQEQQLNREMENNQPSVRSRLNVHVMPCHQMITESLNIPVPLVSAQSRSTNNHHGQQTTRTLQYNDPSARSCSRARVASQHRMLTESSNISSASIPSQSLPYIYHREPQSLRASKNTPMSIYQNYSNRQMRNYGEHQNSEDNLCQYPSRTIISSARSRLNCTLQEEIHRTPFNQRISKSIDTSSNTSYSGHSRETFRKTPNSLVRFPKYNI